MSTYRKHWLAIASIVALAGVGCGDDGTTDPTDAGVDANMMMTDGGDMDAGPEEDGGPVEDAGPVEAAETLVTVAGTEATASEEAECRWGMDDVTFRTATPAASAGCVTPADVELLTEAGAINCDDEGITCVDANITEATTWSCDQVYVLRTAVYVQGATLTVEPGTFVIGASGDQVVSDDPTSALIVETSAMIEAIGRAEQPIFFTSVAAADGDDATAPAPGDWGGMVLLGLAPINVDGGTNSVEGLAANAGTNYGGSDAAHDCGVLRYTRVMWVGFEFSTDNELNGITVAGCGSATEMDFVQVHGGEDDGIEFFGGEVNARYIVVSQVNDDSFDTDEGFAGSVQFGIAQQGVGVGNRTVEADNNGDAEDATPRSTPTFLNMTFVGQDSEDQQGLRLRAGTAGAVANSYVTGFGEEDCIRVDGSVSIGQANGGTLDVHNNVIRGCRERSIEGSDQTSHFRFTADDGDADSAFTGDWADDNFDATAELLMAPQNETEPNFAPMAANSPLNGAAAATVPEGFVNAGFAGAVEPPSTAGACWSWYEGWTSFAALPE